MIANVEAGRDNTTRIFWHNADAALGAHGALLARFDQVDALARNLHAQRVRARDQERQQFPVPPAPSTTDMTAGPRACEGCRPVVVGRWTRREVRALREALRMSVRTFAGYLGVTTTTVADWEHRTAPTPPRLAAQSLLDQALTLADTNSKARFRLLLDTPEDLGPRTHDGPASPARSTVTPIHHAARTRPIS